MNYEEFRLMMTMEPEVEEDDDDIFDKDEN